MRATNEAPVPRGVRLRSQVAHLPALPACMGCSGDCGCRNARGRTVELNKDAMLAAQFAFDLALSKVDGQPTVLQRMGALNDALEAYEKARPESEPCAKATDKAP